MKVLFTSVGRRVELVQAFKDASIRLGIPLDIYGADISFSAPALQFCDRTIIVPRISDETYIPRLKIICEEESIDALIPTIDTDLLLLAKYKSDFANTRVIISDLDKIEICRDKRKTVNYFKNLGLLSPSAVDNWVDYQGDYPAFIKPRDGSSSINAFKVKSQHELRDYAEKVPDYIVQQFVRGIEYTVDILCDFDGNPIFITPRIRHEVRSGEVMKTEIKQDETIISEMLKLIQDFKPCGQITVQLIQTLDDRKNYYIEINPRFGGGAPLSMKAGADSAEMIIRLLDGEKVEYQPNAAEDGAMFSRFDQSVRIR